MARYFYPALFHPEEVGYSVSVPDLDGCFTEGPTIEEAYTNCVEAVGLYLEELDASQLAYPKPSEPRALKKDGDDFFVVVEFDPLAYRRRHDTRAVKKTLTIPSWLNAEAESHHVNFSGVLQEALKDHLGIQ